MNIIMDANPDADCLMIDIEYREEGAVLHLDILSSKQYWDKYGDQNDK
jgi:hypothetical protein